MKKFFAIVFVLLAFGISACGKKKVNIVRPPVKTNAVKNTAGKIDPNNPITHAQITTAISIMQSYVQSLQAWKALHGGSYANLPRGRISEVGKQLGISASKHALFYFYIEPAGADNFYIKAISIQTGKTVIIIDAHKNVQKFLN